MGGINAAKQAVRNHALNASQMQSRLDRALLHYHNFLTRNKALQSEIQELRSALMCIVDGSALLQAAGLHVRLGLSVTGTAKLHCQYSAKPYGLGVHKALDTCKSETCLNPAC